MLATISQNMFSLLEHARRKIGEHNLPIIWNMLQVTVPEERGATA